MIRLSGRIIAAGALALAVVIVLASMQIFGWGFFQRSTADWRGQTGVVEQVSADADYRIGAYEEFYDRCYAVKALEGQIELAEQTLAAAQTDWDQHQANENLTALRNQRINLIEAYNADARKADTKANFHASDLPYQLDTDKDTTCDA